MYQFQKNRLFGASLLNTLIAVDDESPLQDMIHLNLNVLS